MGSKSIKKGKLFRFFCLLAYIVCAIVLIVESCLNGKISAGQSNAVGGGIADIVNGLGGDQTVAVKPEKIVIENKVEKAYVGENQQIEVSMYPENTTYKSVNYVSSNENVAVVSSDGEISYLQEGSATIQVINEHYKSIKDSFEVNVYNVEATDLSVNINAEKEDDIYILDLHNTSYYVECDIIPENTTFKNVSYELDKKDYINISEDGRITPIKYSKGEVTTITIKTNEISKQLKVIVDMNIIKLEKLSYTATQEIYPGQSINPKVIYYPSDSTYKDYSLSTSDSSIVSISSKSYKGIKKGKATITIKSKEYPDIQVSFEVEVLDSPILKDFKVQANSKLLIDAKGSISISNVTPKYAQTTSIKYESLNPDILSVDSKGNYKGLKVGKGQIRIYSDDKLFEEKIVTINVIERTPNNDYTVDFDIDYLKSEKVAIVANQEIDLKDYFGVKKFYYDNNIPTTNKEISYSIIENDKELVRGSNLTIKKPGHYMISIIHNASHISKEVEIVVIDAFDILTVKNTLYVNESLEVAIVCLENEHQDYVLKIDDESVATIHKEQDKYMIDGLNEGLINLTVIPVYDGVTYENLSKVYSFNVTHKYAEYIGLQLQNENGDVINSGDVIFVDGKYNIISTADEKATIYNFIVNSDNEDILTIDNEGKIDIHGIGSVKITLLDTYSNNFKEIEVFVKNKIVVDNKEPVVLLGDKVEVKENTYYITNGHSAKISLNFDKSSTYTKTKYTSSDEAILSVGSDGTLTPHKSGDAVITLLCDDGNGDKIEISVNIHVKRQELITDLSAFFYKVRKAIGHFGAFLVLGIFSTFTYMLYMKNKKWLIAVPVNFVSGFIIALITEIIQTYIPGRYGSFNDVLIDYAGFISSSIILTIIIFIYYYVQYKKTYK